MTCPHCSHLFSNIKSATRGANLPLNGDMLLCPTCGIPSIVYENHKLRPMLEEEFKELSDAEKADLRYACRCIIDKAKRKGSENSLILPPWLKR